MSHKTDPVDALHAALLSSKQGIAGAARLIGRSAQVLYNKFSDSMPGNELTGREERALAERLDSDAYIDAVAAYFGGVFFRIPEGVAADDDILETYLTIIERMGELSNSLTGARSDGVIDKAEFRNLKEHGYATMAAIQSLLAEIETTVREIPDELVLVERRVGAR